MNTRKQLIAKRWNALTKEELTNLYINADFGVTEIAVFYKVSVFKVCAKLKYYRLYNQKKLLYHC